uniref:hypothetical protein n=1 Tax=uncultured Duncaniella sp. TaxID=2768039 RepID=UPI0025B67046
VFFDGCVRRPCGASVDYVAEVVEDVYAAAMAGDGQRVVQGGGINTFLTLTTRRDTDEEDDDTVLFDGDIITCTIAPISREMHNYLEALQNDSNGPAMFSGDKCLGYFMATSPVSESIAFHPDEIPEFK